MTPLPKFVVPKFVVLYAAMYAAYGVASPFMPSLLASRGLTADEIEKTANAGAMWLQLEPTDGYKLLGAVRGVLRAA